MPILIIADDLSGAADCAIPFVRAGQPTLVTLESPRNDANGFMLAIDADTRRMDSEAAARRNRDIYAAHHRPGQRLYKKIDSTLRGNWAAEVAALRPLAGMALVAPAHPALGRTVRGANVYVGGRTLAETEVWKLEHGHRPAAIDAQLQQAGLSTATLDADTLRDDPEALAARIAEFAQGGVDALVADAGHEQALRSLALATAQSPATFFWVGSGGLAREIAALQAPTAQVTGAMQLSPSQGPILVLVGSLSSVTDRQCAVLRDDGPVPELVVPVEVLRQGATHRGWPSLQAQVGDRLGQGSDLLIRIGREHALDPAEGPGLAAGLAKLAGPHFDRIGALIATGGETARAMLVEAGIDTLELLAELETGVAVGIPRNHGLHRPYIVTKAGAFGGDRTLFDAWSRLRRS